MGKVGLSTGLARSGGFPRGLASGLRGRFLIAFFLEGGYEFLHNVDAHEGAVVGKTSVGYEEVEEASSVGFGQGEGK